ncbi:hypothetical protein, partial [Escherichia coli]|uniref:hypothetical protein n=1 Tax=Escherichia coli TaxID=562 RepID=UPI001FCEB014
SHWSTSKTPSYTKSVSWQHHRDTGCKAIYFVLISLGLTLFSIISAAIEGVRCESLSVQLNVAWILFTTIILSAIPSAKMSLSAH